jgi:hypothetical protein
VFVSRTRFTPEDLAFLSGFVAGDGSFIIGPNNAGTSWCCSLIVQLRADDTPLLARLREWSGVGQLFRVAAQGRSQPQTKWSVTRRADCLEIARILSRRPPLGKAAAQFDLWRLAVEAWATNGGASPALPVFAARMRELHRSVVPVPCPVDITEAELMPFLAGFASAEAHFGASDQGSPAFVINLRADDGPLLGLFHRTLGVGHLRDIAPAGSSRAALSWRVGRLSELRRLVEFFEAYRPRGRAGYVYAAWRELVRLELRTSTIRRALAIEVRRRRRFVAGRDRIERASVAERRRTRCEEALRRWARSDDYPGSVLDYERWRRSSGRGAPSRSTIAAAFGSWLAALETVGLQTAASHSRERVAAITSGSARHHAAQRARSRRAIIAAVRRCIEEIGHEPAATEFLRWRAERAPESPCQMTIYRHFPGGFAEVLAAASS